MRCPNCGSFIEDSQEKCYLCGTNLKTNSTNSPSFETNNNFGESGFSNPGSGFQNQNFNNPTEEFQKRKENYQNRTNAMNFSNRVPEIPKEEKDIFDFYQEHKRTIKIVSFFLLGLLALFIVIKIIEHKTTPKEKEPLLNNLYYEIDAGFTNTTSSSNKVVYTKSGSKGSACSIGVSYGTSTSGDHVNDYYESAKKALEPETDRNGNVVDPSKIFITRDSEATINDIKWYFMSVYYRTDIRTQQFNILRYRYYTAVYNGYFYDIELVNNSNDASCNSSLDNFIKSLKFIYKNKK